MVALRDTPSVASSVAKSGQLKAQPLVCPLAELKGAMRENLMAELMAAMKAAVWGGRRAGLRADMRESRMAVHSAQKKVAAWDQKSVAETAQRKECLSAKQQAEVMAGQLVEKLDTQ